MIAAAQRIEHDEIAGCGTATTLADQLGYDCAEELLNETLGEEARLTKIATGGLLRSGVNDRAGS